MYDKYPQLKRKTPEEFLQEIYQDEKGKLKLFVGAAPGVGKSYRILLEAHDLKKQGVDIVIGLIETHGRKETAERIKDLEIIPKKIIEYKDKKLEELNIEKIIERRPDVVIIDELAHTNVPGSKNKKRYMDVEEILDAGINVVSAVNIQHIESVHDIVQHITGVAVRERIPDRILDIAHEVILIDVTPEMLRQRLIEGKIYAQEKIDQALNNFFTKNNLGALRELSLREIADDVDEKLLKSDIVFTDSGPTGVAEKILVCVQYGPSAEKLIRRGWRIANRLNAELYVLNVLIDHRGNISQEQRKRIRGWKKLAVEFNAKFILERSRQRKIPQVITDVAKEHHITQIILGQSARTRWEEITKGSIVNSIMRNSKNIDIHIVSEEQS
ncbi:MULTISPECIES: KdpD-like non-kinase potassium sensor [Fictibacillus]|jgi:two-component system, OmpR family, sensor histidine kinase KdpD|uniref:KdpD-like non-kinase potassium sensor n=1 Tax=Fictibacillus TaxID=1329200 RepID=UPI0018CE85F6|nr:MULTISPECIES: KdpD-like non-kinase potassium sensor [unclassified Fictibacillus]MBH0155372.1 universal stress protein [Fictibacillus sp. 5RED26]MBH0161481.1 universal stress protein [Fictibacillus sp. 26RED30]